MDISIKVTYKSEGLQKLRKAAGLSQSQLADLAGIKVQVLQQYERGARDINGAKLPTLLKSATRWSVGWLTSSQTRRRSSS